jgi:hypothetical protein
MTDARIGSVLVASLHQAIADVLPLRADFYEHWLHTDGLHQRGLGMAPMLAVLGFLRVEPDAYAPVVTRAGRYAASWEVDALPALRRRLALALPRPLRLRAALRVGRRLVRRVHPQSQAVVSVRRRGAHVEIRRSLFCDAREVTSAPLCGFYAGAFERLLELFELQAGAAVKTCRAMGASGCTLEIGGRRSSPEHETAPVT